MDTLTGTPVVPGIAHGPALIARTDVSADAIAGFDPSAFPDEDAAMTRYDEVAAAVADGFAAKAGQASGAAAEVLTASAGLARTRGCARGCSSSSAPATTCWSPSRPRSSPSSRSSPAWAA